MKKQLPIKSLFIILFVTVFMLIFSACADNSVPSDPINHELKPIGGHPSTWHSYSNAIQVSDNGVKLYFSTLDAGNGQAVYSSEYTRIGNLLVNEEITGYAAADVDINSYRTEDRDNDGLYELALTAFNGNILWFTYDPYSDISWPEDLSYPFKFLEVEELDFTLPFTTGAFQTILSAQDADLSNAPDVVVEPRIAPHNLGGWVDENSASFSLELPEQGNYIIEVGYSRPNISDIVHGIVEIETDKGETITSEISFTPTSNQDNDWSVYKITEAVAVELPAGSFILSLAPKDLEDGHHFINLRSIAITSVDGNE